MTEKEPAIPIPLSLRASPQGAPKNPFLPTKKQKERPFRLSFRALLHALLVSLDHFLDHLAADGASLTGSQVTVVAVGEVDPNLPWCPFYILN